MDTTRAQKPRREAGPNGGSLVGAPGDNGRVRKPILD